MFEDYSICPYTGLRSFTEEESLYFKGRDEHIEEATAQLEQNKFLMLTGASGDGKSSLVFAGIIPNARAGFLKAKFTQWCVADFRPERSPFKNLCSSLAAQLGIESVSTVESELKYGFSALVELYRNSSLYVDKESREFLEADQEKKDEMDRNAANLFILVDQFEEFFTNPENYIDGVTSSDANLVVNLLLETARIAVEENLPIYIVFTMRSDYIGQCAAFRGLPEYIGYSQFFVPRLNRKELRQVVEEPAELSGNRISRRLTERLIHDLTEGVDQLPILQHALNLIWHEAENGQQEMDLLHYARVGGMAAEDLPEEQQGDFKRWFSALSPAIQDCYSDPGLQNVLNTHTNKLFEHAGDYYREKSGETLDREGVQEIIKTTFTCLTKIDESRAVRNRMSLVEITRIIGYTEGDFPKVGKVINLFREPGNTLIRPFITEEDASEELSRDTVLDITHESLIRNWELLDTWAQEEYQNYTVFLDFQKQLDKWVESGRKRGFLLSIGPLTFFENWYNKAQPNQYWIARYLPEELDKEDRYRRAKRLLSDMRDFLKRSARKHVVTRTVMKYGAGKVAAILAVIGVVLFSSFSLVDYYQSRNSYLEEKLTQETFRLSNSQIISAEYTAPLINMQLATNRITLHELLQNISNTQQKLNVLEKTTKELLYRSANTNPGLVFAMLEKSDSILSEFQVNELNDSEFSEYLDNITEDRLLNAYQHFLNPEGAANQLVKRSARRSAEAALHIMATKDPGFSDMNKFFLNLEHALNYGAFTDEELELLLHELSTFENNSRSEWIIQRTRRDQVLSRGSFDYGLNFNGLYHELALLYAATGNFQRMIQAVDSTHQYSGNYYQQDPELHVDNYRNVIPVLEANGHREFIPVFLQEYGTRYRLHPARVYNNFIAYSMPLRQLMPDFINLYEGTGQQYINMNVWTLPDEVLYYLFDKLDEELEGIESGDERNFYLSLNAKNRGIALAVRAEIRKMEIPDEARMWFDRAIELYKMTGGDYSTEPIQLESSYGDDLVLPRNSLILYPDFRHTDKPFEGRSRISWRYTTAFADYLIQREDFPDLYKTDIEFQQSWEGWHLNYYNRSVYEFFSLAPLPDPAVMERIYERVKAVDEQVSIEMFLFTAIFHYVVNGELDKAVTAAEKADFERFGLDVSNADLNFIRRYYLEQFGEIAAGLTKAGRMDLASAMLREIEWNVNISTAWATAAKKFGLMGGDEQGMRQLYDSALFYGDRVETDFTANKVQMAVALGYLEGESALSEAKEMVRNMFPGFNATWSLCRAMGYRKNLSAAFDLIPPLSSTSEECIMYQRMMEGYYYDYNFEPSWKYYFRREIVQRRNWIIYVNL